MESGFLGLASLGFWLFIAACVVGGIWDGVKKREAQHETLRRMVESGKPVDEQLMDKVLGRHKRPDVDLTVAGTIVLFVSPGLLALGYFVGAFRELLGVAALVAFVGLGLLAAARFSARAWREEKNDQQRLG